MDLCPLLIWSTCGFGLGVLVAALVFPPDAMLVVFAEGGAVEQAAIVFWLVVAAYVVWRFRLRSRWAFAGTSLCLFSAAREADLHISYTGYSVLKLGFYTSSEYLLREQIVAGLLVAMLAVSAFIIFGALINRLREVWQGGEFKDWHAAAIFVIGLIVFSKILDRAPAFIEEVLGYAVTPRVFAMSLALEEALETLLPLLVLAVVRLIARERDRTHSRRDSDCAPA